MLRTNAMNAACHNVDELIAPRTVGFSDRPAWRSRSASRASLDHPMDSWPASTAQATRMTPCQSRPAAIATTVITSVTVAVGPGWHAST